MPCFSLPFSSSNSLYVPTPNNGILTYLAASSLIFNTSLKDLELHRKESAWEWWRLVTGEDAPISRNHLQLTYQRSPLLGLPIFPSKSQPWLPVHPRSNFKSRLGFNSLWTHLLPPLRSWICIWRYPYQFRVRKPATKFVRCKESDSMGQACNPLEGSRFGRLRQGNHSRPTWAT